MGMVTEFKEFALKGNVVDMAVGVIIGGAFGKIVSSLVADVLMPPINYAVTLLSKDGTGGGLEYPFREAMTGADGKKIDAIVLKYGVFMNTILDFLIVAICLFLVIKAINMAKSKLEKKAAEAPAAPAEPPADVKLLSEIRDLLKAR